MDKPSERLMRASLHDLANALSGIRGILDLSDPRAPLTNRDRDRLESVILEGLLTLERSRHLCMETLPESPLERGEEWRTALREQIRPLEVLFRATVQFTAEIPPSQDRWPGDLLRSWVQAVTRLVLAYVNGPTLTLEFHATEFAWTVRWGPLTSVPEALVKPDPERPRDIPMRWVERMSSALGVQWMVEPNSLQATLPRT